MKQLVCSVLLMRFLSFYYMFLRVKLYIGKKKVNRSKLPPKAHGICSLKSCIDKINIC